MPHRDVSTTKRNNARRMRVEMTDAERKLWHAIKAHRLRDFAFRRQVPIGPYIADFVCHQASLIVEVDGGQHSESASDEQRDAWFVDHGFRVVRFWNNDVLTNLDGVLVRIIEMVERDSTTPLPAAAPPPSPSRGEGLRRATGEVTTEWEVKR